MNCYFQGCDKKGITKEHIPPRSFFPEGEKDQLLTVRSCKLHNNGKSKNDLYVLAQICMNASPNNRAQEVWKNSVVPQLSHNDEALRKMLSSGSVEVGEGVRYAVDVARLDEFFTALSCGLIYKSQKSSLPMNYETAHIYDSLHDENDGIPIEVKSAISNFYQGSPMEILEFGKPDFRNNRIYTAEIYGIPSFKSSITIVHTFYGTFKVISMLTKKLLPFSV